jgi:8-oxo-dGTP diphosphatase
MTRTAILAAGGIVLRQEQPPRIAVVRLRKRNEWVLPKGKLDDGETPRAAAEREVLEETGHDVRVHEFLGTLVYESGGRSKVVHYWRMEARGGQVHELMSDIREVDWLPLEAALQRLTRSYERAFLANVGPRAVEAAAPVRRKTKPQPASRKRRSPAAVTPKPAPGEPAPALAAPDVVLPPAAEETGPVVAIDVIAEAVGVDMSAEPAEAAMPVDSPETDTSPPDAAAYESQAAAESESRPKSIAQTMRDWLRRSA